MSVEREAAIAYARRDLPVFPLHPIVAGRCGCRNPQCDVIGKHPVTKGWPNTIASVSAAETLWRPQLGPRGIGLVCGPASGLFALDADRRHGAEATLAQWRRDGRRSETVTDQTGDGWHFLYRWPEGFDVEIRVQDLGGGVQCRGAGHFVVLAPSMHRSGQRYRWVRSIEDHEIAPAPDWLLELITAAAKNKPTPIALDGERLVAIGHRHDFLVRFLGLCRSIGFGESALVGFTDVYLDTAVEIDEQRHPLDREHARNTARDVARRYQPHRTNGDQP